MSSDLVYSFASVYKSLLTWFVNVKGETVFPSPGLIRFRLGISVELQTGSRRFVIRFVCPIKGHWSLEPQRANGRLGVLKAKELSVEAPIVR